MSPPKKPKLISMRLTDGQYGYLESMLNRVKALTGTKVTRTSIILKLMEYGLPALERDFPRIRSSNDEGKVEPESRKMA